MMTLLRIPIVCRGGQQGSDAQASPGDDVIHPARCDGEIRMTAARPHADGTPASDATEISFDKRLAFSPAIWQITASGLKNEFPRRLR